MIEIRRALERTKEGDAIVGQLSQPFDFYIEPDARIELIMERSRNEPAVPVHLTHKQLLERVIDESAGWKMSSFECSDHVMEFQYRRGGDAEPNAMLVRYGRAVPYKAFLIAETSSSLLVSETAFEAARNRVHALGGDFSFKRNYNDVTGLVMEAYFKETRGRADGAVLAYSQGTLPEIRPPNFDFIGRGFANRGAASF